MLAVHQVAVVVRDYDAAIAFYVGVLGFALVEDTALGGDKRWVTVRPPGAGGASILLARAVDDAQRARVGNQTGGRVFLFLETDDLARERGTLEARGVHFLGPTRVEPYGAVAVFEDLYGNKLDLIQPASSSTG